MVRKENDEEDRKDRIYHKAVLSSALTGKTGEIPISLDWFQRKKRGTRAHSPEELKVTEKRRIEKRWVLSLLSRNRTERTTFITRRRTGGWYSYSMRTRPCEEAVAVAV